MGVGVGVDVGLGSEPESRCLESVGAAVGVWAGSAEACSSSVAAGVAVGVEVGSVAWGAGEAHAATRIDAANAAATILSRSSGHKPKATLSHPVSRRSRPHGVNSSAQATIDLYEHGAPADSSSASSQALVRFP